MTTDRDELLAALIRFGIYWGDDKPRLADDLMSVVEKIAARKAAEELRALANVFDEEAHNLNDGRQYVYAANDCRARANELDPR